MIDSLAKKKLLMLKTKTKANTVKGHRPLKPMAIIPVKESKYNVRKVRITKYIYMVYLERKNKK